MFLHAGSEDWADAQADLSLRWAHRSFLLVLSCSDSFAKPKISRRWLASVAEQTGLSPTRSQIPEDRFPTDVAQFVSQQ